jgi:predicted nuclease of predicted toxin-antitoxin system
VKLLADVNVSGGVVGRLRDLGWVVERAVDHVPANSTDEVVLALTARLGAVLMTRDQDFPALLARSRATQPSVLNIRAETVDAVALASLVDRVLRAARDDLATGAIVTVDDKGARVHRLPLG